MADLGHRRRVGGLAGSRVGAAREGERREHRVYLRRLVNVLYRQMLICAVDRRAARTEDHGWDLIAKAGRVTEPVLGDQPWFFPADQTDGVRHQAYDLITGPGQISALDIGERDVPGEARISACTIRAATIDLRTHCLRRHSWPRPP